ncbi:universal stress protein [Paracoccus sp. TK19116]|uniref:Universal stress protein n=1 Tax=Paracoccus albicereus TaxID=2922394 RepID=A0ABT1MPH2_9RHOB|nr:universal stress protein [Paracoccus albicereus]MCQ0970091.1 universal stress protein [Paracoccus albicereus]
MSRKILVGYDESAASRRALDFAVDRAKARGEGVLVAHVLEWSPYSFLTPEELEQRHTRRQEELARAEVRLMKPAIEQHAQSGVELTSLVKYGHVAETLCKLAETEDVSLVMIGRNGQTGLSSRLFGSVAGTLAQIAPVPVTIVP